MREAGPSARHPPLGFSRWRSELRRLYQINKMKAMSFYFRAAVDDVMEVIGHSGSVSSRSRCVFFRIPRMSERVNGR